MDPTCGSTVFTAIIATVVLGGVTSGVLTNLFVEQTMKHYAGVVIDMGLNFDELRKIFPQGRYRVQRVEGSDTLAFLQHMESQGPWRCCRFKYGFSETSTGEMVFEMHYNSTPLAGQSSHIGLVWKRII